jgi:hypothetical protein
MSVYMSWRLRTSFGDDLVVVRDWDARKQDGDRRVPAPFVRFELQNWLSGENGFGRRAVLQMFHAVRGVDLTWRPRSSGDLDRYVIPALEQAFDRGSLVAYKLPRGEISVPSAPPQEEADAGVDPGPSDWVEIVVVDEEGNPYVGPCRVDLPDGRSISGLNAGGVLHSDGVPSGSCKVVFAELDGTSVRAE